MPKHLLIRCLHPRAGAARAALSRPPAPTHRRLLLRRRARPVQTHGHPASDGSLAPGCSTTSGWPRGLGLPEASVSAFDRRHDGVGGTLAWYAYAHNDRAAAINVCTVARYSLSNDGSHGTGSSTEANQTCDGYLGCPHKNYELFDDNTFTDDCALAVLAGTSTSLTSGRHDPNNFGGQKIEATDQSDDSDRLLQSDITAEAQLSVITFPESEVNPLHS